MPTLDKANNAKEVFGYRVTIDRVDPQTGRKGPWIFGIKARYDSIARHHARNKNGFLAVLKIEPLGESQFKKEFPSGRRTL